MPLPAANQRRLLAVLDEVAQQAAALPEAVLSEFIPVLLEARRELRIALRRWLKLHPDGAERFTAQHYRQALLQLETALRELGVSVPRRLERGLVGRDAIISDTAVASLERQVLVFSRELGGARGMLGALPLDRAAILVQGQKARIMRYKRSAEHYGAESVRDIRRQLALGVVKGETFSQMTARIEKLGLPVPGGNPADRIAGGFYTRQRHSAERIVRTEVLDSYNQQEMVALRALEEEDPGWKKRWDASLDLRVCKLCRSLDGEVRELNENFSSGLSRPPAHPNCRCSVTPWRTEWGSGQLR